MDSVTGLSRLKEMIQHNNSGRPVTSQGGWTVRWMGGWMDGSGWMDQDRWMDQDG